MQRVAAFQVVTLVNKAWCHR